MRSLVRSSFTFGICAALGCASETPPANSADSPPPGPVTAAFKKSFEGYASVYAEQGVVAYGLHRSTVQDQTIILHFVGTDHDKLAALATRPELVDMLWQGGAANSTKLLLGEDVQRSRSQ